MRSQGFCLLNNVAIGAKYALLKYDLQRVAIVDFDVHAGNINERMQYSRSNSHIFKHFLGNGTEEIFDGDNNFLFASIHAVGKHFYPGMTDTLTCFVFYCLNIKSSQVLAMKAMVILLTYPCHMGRTLPIFLKDFRQSLTVWTSLNHS